MNIPADFFNIPKSVFAEYHSNQIQNIGNNKANTVKGFKTLVNILNRLELRYCIIFGTLLGYKRERGFIDHDHDVDFFVDYTNDKQLLKEFLYTAVSKYGFKLLRYEKLISSLLKDSAYYDFYHFRQHETGYECNGITLPLDCLESHPVAFQGVSVRIPKQMDELILKWYGDDWHIPIKGKPAKNY